MKKILIIEDDMSICDELEELLNHSGYKAIILDDFKDPIPKIIKIGADLLLLDINIPYTNGQILLRDLRRLSDVPVIMVTSKNTEIDEVLSMSYGADDYVTKPYNPTILLLRIQAIFKRLDKNLEHLIYRDCIIKPQKGIIEKQGSEILLTKNEMLIFMLLLNNQDRIVTRDQIMTDLWNNSEYINDNALTVNISRLRSKLKEIGYEDAIDTRKGQGYILL